MADTEANGVPIPADQDDFRKIKKITLPVVRALYDLEVKRYADLAALTPGILADLLRSKNVPFVSAQRIEREDWIGQARLLATSQAANVVPEEQDPPAAGADPDMDKKPAGPARHGWRELADFFVSFGEDISMDGKARLKTKAHFSQGDIPFEQEGIATNELVDWMLRQANLTVVEEEPQGFALAEAPESRSGHAAHSEEALPLIVSNLWVSQVNNPASSGMRTTKRMIRVEADVNISPEAAVYLTGPTPFMMTIHLVNTQTNGSIFIETPSVTLSQEMMPYAFQHDFPVPLPGRYQLYLEAGHPSAGKLPILQEGPIVRVEG